MVRLGADHGQAQDGELSLILSVYLCHRHIKSVPQAVLDAADHLPLVLEAARLAEQQPNAERTDYHDKVTR
jgi:hypothetical protein